MEERSRRNLRRGDTHTTADGTQLNTAAVTTRRLTAAATPARVSSSDGPCACLLGFGLRFATTLLIVILIAQAPLVSAWSTQYLYASGPLLVDDDLAHSLGSSAWVRAARSSVTDDHVHDEVQLQFAFPFMHDRRTLAISPNGVLHFDLRRTGCCAPVPIGLIVSGPQCVWVDAPCGCSTLNSAYNYGDSIAPMLSDLDPVTSPGSLISYRSLPGRFDVRWQNLRLAGQGSTPALNGQSFDFIASLHASGLVEFRYLRMVDMVLAMQSNSDPGTGNGGGTVDGKGARCWQVGLRDAGWSNRDATREARMAALEGRPAVDPHAATRATYAAEIAAWGSPRAGFYPALDLVRANSTLSFCPLSTSFCLHPSTVPSTGQHAVQITAERMECAAQGHAFFCRFSTPLSATAADPASIDVSATFTAASNSLSCVAPSLATLRALNASANADLSSFQLRLVDRSAGNLQQVVAMESPLLLSFSAGATAPSALGLCSSCWSFVPLYCVRDCAGTFRGNASVDSCGVCAGGSTGIRPNKDMGCSGRCFERVYVSDSDPEAVYTDFEGVNSTMAMDAADKECFCDRVYQMQFDDSTPAAISTTATGSGSGIMAETSSAAQASSLVMRKLRSDIDAASPAPAPAPPAAIPSPPLTPLPPSPLQRAFVPAAPSSSPSSSAYRSTVFHADALPTVDWSSNFLQPADISGRAAAECGEYFEVKLPLFQTLAADTRYYRWFMLCVLVILVGVWVLLRQMDKSWAEDGAGDFSQRGRMEREQQQQQQRRNAESRHPLRGARASRTARGTSAASPSASALARESGILINEETEDRLTRQSRDLKQQQQLQARSVASKTVASAGSASSSSSSSSSSSACSSLGSSTASSPRPTIHLPAIAEAHPGVSGGSGDSGGTATLILPTAVAAFAHHHSPSASVDSAAVSASEIEAEAEGSSTAEGVARPPLPPLVVSPSAAAPAAVAVAATPLSPASVVATSPSSHGHASQTAQTSSAATSATSSPRAPAIGAASTKTKATTKTKQKQKAASTAAASAAAAASATGTTEGAGSTHRDAKPKHKQRQKPASAQSPRATSPPLQQHSTSGTAPIPGSSLPPSPQSLYLLQQQQAQQLYLQQLSYLAASANLATMDPVTAAAFTRAWNSGALALPASFAAGIGAQMPMPMTMPLTMPPSPSAAVSPPLSPLHSLSSSVHPATAAAASSSSSSGGFAAGGFASTRKSPTVTGGGKKKRAAAGAGAGFASAPSSSSSPPPPLNVTGLPAPFVFTSPVDTSIAPSSPFALSSVPAVAAAPAAAAPAAAVAPSSPAADSDEVHPHEQLFHFKITPPDGEQ